jgi:dihydroorotate dehydrogenase electron transfer subunit
MSEPSRAVIAEAAVTASAPLSDGTALIGLARPEGFPDPAPGQFARLMPLNLGPQGPLRPPLSPLLPRPFSFHKATKTELFFLIRSQGAVTELFQKLAPGAQVRVTGPLGRAVPELTNGSGSLIMIAGGAGLAPMGMFGGSGFRDISLLYGERCQGQQVFPSYLEGLAPNVLAFTEDGSGYGEKGLALDGLRVALAELPPPRTVFACGPEGMLRAAERAVLEPAAGKWPRPSGSGAGAAAAPRLFVSAEAFMACGLGVCLTCSRAARGGGRVRVCADGPVFPAGALDWGRG